MSPGAFAALARQPSDARYLCFLLLKQVHMELLQKRKDEEDAEAAAEEDRRQRKKSTKKKDKKNKKGKKEKKEKKSKKKKQRYSSSSSGSDSGGEATVRSRSQALLDAAMEMERAKVDELRRKEERRTSRKAKRRREEEESLRVSEEDEAADRERLQAYLAAEAHREWTELSRAMMEAPPDPRAPSSRNSMLDDDADDDDETEAERPARIPLAYFSRSRAVAWEYPAPGGHGTSYAPLIGVAAGDDSPDEW